ncbi:MAG: PD-(D/E)XK nuclease family protein [Candidatus Omnitrophica bacterium]|nr:PD-(D/E)XK nuclease family protein [Candidatus Omnitrophota bacterium]
MKDKIISWGFEDNFIKKTAEYIYRSYGQDSSDLSGVVCVFGGRRPALFLQKELAKKFDRSFFPPKILSIDDFIDYTFEKKNITSKLNDLDAGFIIYQLAQKYVPELLKGKESFSLFLPWAREIVSFIDQLDIEAIDEDSLRHIEKSAEIGYEIPESINWLLENIILLSKYYHQRLREDNLYSRGMRYREVSANISSYDLNEFKEIIFANFFFLHETEQKIIKFFLDSGRAKALFQGDQADWTVLKKNADRFGSEIKVKEQKKPNPDISFYQAFDTHSEVCLAHNIIKKNKIAGDNLVVVIPRSDMILPFLTESSLSLGEFNVSLGYPLEKSPLYVLFHNLHKLTESQRNNKYYTKEYLAVLRHPLIKNLSLNADSAVMRVMAHKIEEMLCSNEKSEISGSLFISLDEIEKEEKIYISTVAALKSIGFEASTADCHKILTKAHDSFFRCWNQVFTCKVFSQKLADMINILIEYTDFCKFQFNVKVLEKINLIREEMETVLFSEDEFLPIEVWNIFDRKIKTEMVSFKGSPLKGTQVLGLFETRALTFDNIIILDANESVLPKLTIHEPLIPREVMLTLGINRLEKEEEIQRYQFMRLLYSSKKAHIIYSAEGVSERSRFIEELIWKKQKEQGRLKVFDEKKVSFEISALANPKSIQKNRDMVEFLKTETYSASRINTYLSCPLQFYYQYVLGLREKDDFLDEPQATTIGTFIHELLEESFLPFKGKKPIIDEPFRKTFFRLCDKKFSTDISSRMKSDSFLLKRIVDLRLNKFLDNEKERAVSKIISLEDQRQDALFWNDIKILFRYTIDRIDEYSDGRIIIIDYKTGGSNFSPKKLKDIESAAGDRRLISENIRSFQLPLYYHFFSRSYLPGKINAALYNIRNLEIKELFLDEDAAYRADFISACLEALNTIFDELFNVDIPFYPEPNDRRCQYCPFKLLCR